MSRFFLGLFMLMVSAGVSAAEVPCKQNMKPSHPEGQYLLRTDGVVTDVINGLEWMQCSLGQTAKNGTCTGTPVNYPTWQEALKAAEQYRLLINDNGWRLPNIKELADLVERSCISPAINRTYFPATPPEAYWSNTFDPKGLNINAPGGVNRGLMGRLVEFKFGTEFYTDVSQLKLIRLVREIR